MTESWSGRVSMFRNGTVYIGDSLLQSFLAKYEGKEVTLEVTEL